MAGPMPHCVDTSNRPWPSEKKRI